VIDFFIFYSHPSQKIILKRIGEREDIFEFMPGYIVGGILVGAMLAARTEKQNPLTSEEIEEIGQLVLPKKSIFF